MFSRRKFLQLSSLSAASVCMGSSLTLATGSSKKLENFGFISGIVGKELKGDWKAVLRKAAEYGFTEIETGNYLGDSAAGFLSFLRSVGIKPVIGGIPFTADKAELKQGLDKLAELEMKYAVTYWPWKGGGPFNLEDCKASADILNQMGRICRERGLPSAGITMIRNSFPWKKDCLSITLWKTPTGIWWAARWTFTGLPKEAQTR
jgi:hypothetical protein